MKKLAHRALAVLRNPVLKPAEIWAIRAAGAAVLAYLGQKGLR